MVLLSSPCSPSSQRAEKVALSLFHYNLQYVAGKTRVEKKIITESLDPILDLYLRHPDWGADIEMQGYMIEEVSAKYPDIFKKLKTLVDRKQIDLVCFHYSDQLFIAYPRKDMEWSEKINQDIFEKSSITRSGVVFTQEGQFGEGMLSFMKTHSYSTAVISSNLFKYFHKDADGHFYPYYEKFGTTVIPSAGLTYEDKNVKLQTTWAEFGDAELVATGMSPYEANFAYKPEVLKDFEDKLMKLEVEGYRLAKISDYVKLLKSLKIKSQPLPPVPDGTWQPKDTDNVLRWMGEHKTTAERDVLVLSMNVQSRFDLLAAEALLNFAKKKSKLSKEINRDLNDKLYAAWKEQLLAEVSDATGWTPSPGEVKYSIEHALKAREYAEEIIGTVKKELSYPFILVDTKTGGIKKEAGLPPDDNISGDIKLPLEFEIKANDVGYRVQTMKVSDKEYRLKLFMKKQKPGGTLTLSFPAGKDTLVYSPALMEDKLVEYPFSAFTLDDTYLPLSNGIIGLSDGIFLVKHNDSNHTAVKIDFINRKIEIMNLNPLPDEEAWTFTILFDAKQKALDKANKINVTPTLFR